jgi:hypothetical protein
LGEELAHAGHQGDLGFLAISKVEWLMRLTRHVG